MDLDQSRFVVNEQPYSVWEKDLHKQNLLFIKGITPSYFEHLAFSQAEYLESDEPERRQHAAIALRTSYMHGLETLFALLFATIQAYDCVFGWLLKYQLNDLRTLVENVQKRQPILSYLHTDRPSWEDLVRATLLVDESQMPPETVGEYALLWQRFASDFLSGKDEYNHFKHGFRIRPGGSQFAIGAEAQPGTPAAKMVIIGKSDFGTSYISLEKVANSKLDYGVRHTSENWDPNSYVSGLQFIAMSMSNIIAALNVHNGVSAETIVFQWPNEAGFEALNRHEKIGIGKFSFGPPIAEMIKPTTKEDVLKVYNKSDR